MKLVSLLKKNKLLKYIIKNQRLKKEYISDYNFFKNNYSHSKETLNKIKYNMILIIHSLEKGMSNNELRPFGIKKVKELIDLILKYESYTSDNCFEYDLSLSILFNYKKLYEEKKWNDNEEYAIVNDFIKNRKYLSMPAGSTTLYKDDFKEIIKNIDYDAFLSTRHAVRNFDSKGLKKEDIEKAVNMAIKSPSACNRQMVKVNYVTNNEKKNYIINNAQGLSGFELENINFFVITFDVNANYFEGERNQGWFNSGLFSMNFVNAMHSLGIGSCFLQFGSRFKKEEEFKKILEIPENERIAVIIAAGYYANESKIPCSARKEIEDIYRVL